VEVVTHCHVQYGRQNKLGSAVDMLKWQRDNSIPVEKAAKMSPEELEDKIITGILVDKDLPVYEEEYEKVRERAKGLA
jgi:2-oxoglutarate ferredoxin oxidoreductase subunit beta